MCIEQYNKPSQTSNLWNTVAMAILVRRWVYHSIPALFYPAQKGNHTKCTMSILRTVCLEANPNAELSATANTMHNEYPKQTAKETVSNKHWVTRTRVSPPRENTWGAVGGSRLFHEVWSIRSLHAAFSLLPGIKVHLSFCAGVALAQPRWVWDSFQGDSDKHDICLLSI